MICHINFRLTNYSVPKPTLCFPVLRNDSWIVLYDYGMVFYSKPRLFGTRDDGEWYFHTNLFPSGPKSFIENPNTKAFKQLSNGIHTPTVCSALKTTEQASLAVIQTPMHTHTHTHIRSSSPLCLQLMNS